MKIDKKAQTHFPFQLIFSLILIVVFLSVAFFVIRHFLEIQRCSQIGLFVRNLQSEIDEIWHTQEANTYIELDLPTNLEYVCFANLSDEINLVGLNNEKRRVVSKIYDDLKIYFKYKHANLFFYPWYKACNMPSHLIRHIDTKELGNPYCIKNNKGKIKFRLFKSINDALVKIK